MKPQIGAEHQRAEDSARRPFEEAQPAALPVLDPLSARVLEYLQSSKGGLTSGQLEAGLACGLGPLQEALDGLVQQRLVSRLNTVIPSYCYRRPGPGVHEA